jgi:polysaccharide export outer membrane protein
MTRLLLALASLALSACAHSSPALLQPSADEGFTAEPVPEPPGMDAVAPTPFQLRPGDVLSLATVSPAPLSAPRLVVDEAGLLHAPLVGAVPVAGLGLEEAQALIQERLRRYDRFGLVALTVLEPAGHRVSVLGAVERPGAYVLGGGGTRVAELLALAGGLKVMTAEAELADLADLEAARLLRGGTPLPISVARALAGDTRHDIPVAPGDVLFVPALQGASVRVLGEVASARIIPWRPGLRLSEALARAGGMTGDADSADLRVVRGPLSRPKLYRASFSDVVSGRAPDVELARGDIVFVTTHWFASVADVLQRLTPLLTVGAAAATLMELRAEPVSR